MMAVGKGLYYFSTSLLTPPFSQPGSPSSVRGPASRPLIHVDPHPRFGSNPGSWSAAPTRDPGYYGVCIVDGLIGKVGMALLEQIKKKNPPISKRVS